MSTPPSQSRPPGEPGRPEEAQGAVSTPSDQPSPPRTPQTLSEGTKLIGGLIVVCAGLTVVALVAVVAMLLINDTSSDVVAVATASFSVVGTVVGAYFGVKIGSDGTQAAVAGLKDEAAKAQAFAAHVPPDKADAAIAHAKALGAGPPPASTGTRGQRRGRANG